MESHLQEQCANDTPILSQLEALAPEGLEMTKTDKSAMARKRTPKNKLEFGGKIPSAPEENPPGQEFEVPGAPDEDSFNNTESASSVLPFQPFPFEILPSVLSEFCLAQAASIGCDPTLVLLPALAVMATAIGNSRRISIRRTWSEPAILWTACVADPCSGKFLAFEAATRPLNTLQAEAREQFEQQTVAYQRRLHGLNDDSNQSSGPFSILRPPMQQHVFLSDVAIEIVVPALALRPRGLAIVNEDLTEWFMRLSDIKRKRTDEAFYLPAYAGRSTQMIRKSGIRMQMTSAVLSITGTIPQIVLMSAARGWLGATASSAKRNLDKRPQSGSSGWSLNASGISTEVMARLLLTMPPEQRRQWADDEVPDEIIERYEQLISQLSAMGGLEGLPPRQHEKPRDEQSQPSVTSESFPVSLEMTARARNRFKKFYNDSGAARCDLEAPLMKAAWSMVEVVAARIALIIACARFVMGERKREVVDERDIAAGIAAACWFAREAGRIESVLAETPEMTEQRCLAEWIRLQGGSIGISELRQRRHRYRIDDSAEVALEALVTAGFGTWGSVETTPHGGRPTRRFVLRSASE